MKYNAALRLCPSAVSSQGRTAQGHESLDVAQDRESFDVAQDRELVERLVERLVEWQMDFLRSRPL